MAKELEKMYNPQEVEDKIYQKWLDDGSFNAEVDPEKEPFCIVIPPPNVTGQLHMGHAMDETLQDILIRWKRMQGYSALWMPGTDHAGIATQIKAEEELRNKEGLSRHDLGREKFLERVWAWKNKYGSTILNQMHKLGASCDWRRERFTMDEGCSRAVKEVFVNLYEKGLIYQGNRIINWCPDCTTALSDAEVEYEEKGGHFWHIRYPVKDSDEYVVIATTRPETMLGDTAVAVHPEDERYAHLVGKTLILPLVDREIPVIADEYVDKEFGTGCVKITPSHDPNDFEVGKRHNLPEILVLDDKARVNENGGVYQGLDRYDARKKIVADLEAGGYILKTEAHNHNVGSCYRCGTTVEPVTSKQWFVKMKPLAEKAIEVVKNGEISFVPDRFFKIYLNWMENVHDWCISRQLWWGHQIPAYHCADCGKTVVSKEDVTVCPECGSHKVAQDPDVLDTWFSSALWPFSTLGWPDKTPELEYFYPTNVLVTGYDIIFFWVARMIFSGLEQMGEIPFEKVFLHGIVRDAQGLKMSKSLGNGVDPLEVINQYGADALRFSLVTGVSPGNDTRFVMERVESNRNFINKLWNAARYVLMRIGDETPVFPEHLELEDKWVLTRLNRLTAEVTENLEKFELGVAAAKLYDFVWDIFCDWYIEMTKSRILGDDPAAASAAKGVLHAVLADILKLLHPFIPFVTEKIWQSLPAVSGNLITSSWPVCNEALCFDDEAEQMDRLTAAIRAIRNRRAEMNVPPSKKAQLLIVTDSKAPYENGRLFIERLASASSLVFASEPPEDVTGLVQIVTGADRIFIAASELVDQAKEKERITRELAKAEAELAKLNQKLANPGFINKAPEKVVANERSRAASLTETVAGLKDALSAL
jgi:valyl-tRNA synthetase